MTNFSRGSEWRKWDLHVHSPATKLSNNYDKSSGKPDWVRFCRIIHESDVEAFGITDYFSLDHFFTLKREYKKLHPASRKVFFPNLELRLNEVVNSKSEVVDFHIIFRPDLTEDQAREFLSNLRTQISDKNGKRKTCAHLTSTDFKNATVSRTDIQTALLNTFGEKAVLTDHVILVAAANNNGIRADTGSKRKMNIADEIDKFANGFFGSAANVDWFLAQDRYEARDFKSTPKPVFAGSDAHSFEDLEAWLGQEILDDENRKHITWVKADLSFEGLQQTLVEPSERVRIQPSKPDYKEPYKYISKVKFADSSDFPEEIVLNPNLNAIIGSRSSGKSALLAYIAHAVDPDYTVRQQVAATSEKPEDVGPAAGYSWGAVANVSHEVEWAANAANTGRIIYIPQNSLYAISERPREITAKIRPAAFRIDPAFEVRFKDVEGRVKRKNDAIRNDIERWFSVSQQIQILETEIRGLGDRQAVAAQRDNLTREVEELQKSSAFQPGELAKYQQILEDIKQADVRLSEIGKELHALSAYVEVKNEGVTALIGQVEATITLRPDPSDLEGEIRATLQTLTSQSRGLLVNAVEGALVDHCSQLIDEQKQLTARREDIQEKNKELLAKSTANAQITALIKKRQSQSDALALIDNKSEDLKEKAAQCRKLLEAISTDVAERDALLQSLVAEFNAADLSLDGVRFRLEIGFSDEDLVKASSGFNKQAASTYVDRETQRVKVALAQADPSSFVEYMGAGKQRTNSGETPCSLTQGVLTATKELRFVAELDGDRIGGFTKTSMTPGKQALFALTLILGESDEPWPLLIDQPEDDLDSRSIYDHLVQDLLKRKRERQIIMVSHNANLVVGADSEEVLVANRHGDDSPNANGRTFEYLTGSLENSKKHNPNAKTRLSSAGIREHACEILDGGEVAFQKRKDKYKI